MFKLAGLGEDLYLFIKDNVANIVLALFAYLYECHHNLELLETGTLFFQLSDEHFQIGLFLVFFTFIFEQFHRLAYHLHRQVVSDEIHSLELLHQWIFLEQSIHQFHLYIIIFYNKQVNLQTAIQRDSFNSVRLIYDHINIQFSKDMQGSRTEQRSNWKQAVKKDNPTQSRIFGVNRELPNKFSPARFNTNENTSKSLIKQKSNNYSHDQFAIAAILSDSRERSSSRQPILNRKSTAKQLKTAEADEQSTGKPRLQSFKSIDMQLQKQSSKVNHKEDDLDIVRELKLEFLRFKEKVLKQLRKQQEELKHAIQQIYSRVDSLHNCTESPIQFKSSPISLKLNNISLSSPKFEGVQSPISKYLEILNKQGPDTIETESLKPTRKVDAASIIKQSFTPQIKERMSKFDELLSSLKQDLNQEFPIERNPSNPDFVNNDS